MNKRGVIQHIYQGGGGVGAQAARRITATEKKKWRAASRQAYLPAACPTMFESVQRKLSSVFVCPMITQQTLFGSSIQHEINDVRPLGAKSRCCSPDSSNKHNIQYPTLQDDNTVPCPGIQTPSKISHYSQHYSQPRQINDTRR